MARAIALRGSELLGRKSLGESRATVRNAINLWPYKNRGRREEQEEVRQFAGEETTKALAGPCKKRNARESEVNR